MSGYSAFAAFYDRLQSGVDYAGIARLIDGLVKEKSSYDEVGVDLACGTGSLTVELAGLGYEMIGTDISEEMLTEARRKSAGLEITYLCQDMRELELWGAADFVVCMLDSLNHLSSPEDFARTVERAAMYTCAGGLFIFDLNTRYKHEKVLGDNCFCFETDDLMCVWRNSLNDDMSVDIALDFFEKRPDGAYDRYTEEFSEIVYDPDFVADCLEEKGFEIIEIFDDLSDRPLRNDSERALYVCRRRDE